MAITKGGVFYDLEESYFEFTVYTATNEPVTFVFSSKSHLDKFRGQVGEFIDDFNMSIRRKYGISPHMRGYPAVILYSRIETRGFKIYWHGCCRSLKEVEEKMKEGVLNG